jgi:hypothetical protein
VRTTRRVSRAATLAAAAAVLTSSMVTSSFAAPVRTAAPAAESACDPHEHRAAEEAGMARLRRAPDQRDYTLHELRRIDRRLEATLARKGLSGSRSARFGAVVRIPVHAHVIDGNRSRGPSQKRVQRQLTILNRAYAGGQSVHNSETRFRFYLESFDRVRNQRWLTATAFGSDDQQARRTLHVGGPEALNIYFSKPRAPQTGTFILGYSTVPWQARRAPRLDGVTIHTASMPGGSASGYNRGDTTVHEVGHWLGLFHTFEGGCSELGDLVGDTPAENEPSFACEHGRDTCPDQDGADPIHNFMDYSFDTCMNQFSAGQVSRMTDNWLAYRTP